MLGNLLQTLKTKLRDLTVGPEPLKATDLSIESRLLNRYRLQYSFGIGATSIYMICSSKKVVELIHRGYRVHPASPKDGIDWVAEEKVDSLLALYDHYTYHSNPFLF